jgi:predicted RNase H-like nuclease (RuvC/YqgF family)
MYRQRIGYWSPRTASWIHCDYCLERLERELAKRTRQLDADLLGIQKRKATLEKELANFQRMCADGFDSQTIREGITSRESEIRELVTKLAGRNGFSRDFRRV